MPPGTMDEFEIHELSGVDTPAQKGARAVFMKAAGEPSDDYDPVMKREFTAQRRKELAASGHALPDGSFPIENEGDLHNAVRAIGRAKNVARAKSHIISRAKSMGMSSALPDDWVKKEGLMDPKELRKALGLAETATDAEVTARLAALGKADDELKKAKDTADKAEKIAGLSGVEKGHYDTLPTAEQDAFLAMSKSARASAIAKAVEGDEIVEISGQRIRKSEVTPGVFAVMKAQEKQIADSREEARVAKEAAELSNFEKRAREELPNTTGTVRERAIMLKAIEGITDEGARKAAMAQLRAADKVAGSTFQLVGKRGGMGSDADNDDDCEAKLNKLAKEIVAKDGKMTFEKAFEKACIDNPAVYAEYRTQKRAASKAAAA